MASSRKRSALVFILLLIPITLTTSPVVVNVSNSSMYDTGFHEQPFQTPETENVISTGSSLSRVPLDGAEWISFVTSATPGMSSEVIPKSRDNMGLCVDSNFYGMYNLTMYVNETWYNYLHIPNAGHITGAGKPAVPMITRYLELPHNVDVTIKILYSEMQVLDGFNVIPAQLPHFDYQQAPEPPFIIDNTTYTTDAFFPSENVAVSGAEELHPIIIRGHRIVGLHLYPVQFNPVTKQVRVYSKIEVGLVYDKPGQVGVIDSRLVSPDFEALCQGFIINYQYRPGYLTNHAMEKAYTSYTRSPEEGAEYLIITHDDFFQSIMPLADWKEAKGMPVRVVTTSTINPAGPSAAEIASYIQTAYDTWDPAPSYVLLVGDSEFLPTHYGMVHPGKIYAVFIHGGAHIATDLYYATVDGDDYFPDIYVGRLSVDTWQQADAIVNKILSYECSPTTDSTFYSNIAATAFFQDSDDNGYEDRRFVLTSEEIRNFLRTQGYAVDRIYSTDPEWDPQKYNFGLYDNGEDLPNDLKRPTFAWDGDAIDITNSLEAGRFLIYHRDHGNSENMWDYWHNDFADAFEGWDDPFYTSVNITDLTNDDLFTFVLSIECLCGWFDGETDQTDDPKLTNSIESFCEAFVRQAAGGAIAAIGASRVSCSGYNDALVKGFIDAIWTGFDPAFSPGELYRLGQVLNYGKVYMTSEYEVTDELTQMTFELFHLFGDPELALWTQQPQTLDVTYPTVIGSGWQYFVVMVVDEETGEPIYHAKVCLKGAGVYAVGYTDPYGQVYFNVNPTMGGVLTITATKHNYLPYQSYITATSYGATLTVDPALGPPGSNIKIQGSNFDGNEAVDIYFGGTSIDTTVTASGGSFIIDPFTVPSGAEGPLNVIAVGQTSGWTAVTLFRRLPAQPLPDPYIYCQWDSATWFLATDNELHWDNPCIQLYDKITGLPVESNDLEVLKEYTIRATIYNDATVGATNVQVAFEWASWGAGQITWYPIDTDVVTVPAAIGGVSGTVIAEVDWTPSITGHTCLMITISHSLDENLNNNNGQENTHVQPVSSPGEVTFTLSNPSTSQTLIYLEARQLGGAYLWPIQIVRAYPQVQNPGQNQTVTLVVEAPEEAQEDETRTFTVTAYIDGALIGGIEIQVKKVSPTPTGPSLQELLPTLIIIGVVATVIIIVVVCWRRRKIK